MIGTNNTGQVMQESDETASGIKAIVDLLQDRRPEMKILLLGVFPRSINSNDPQRIINREVNEKIKGLADSKNIHFLDISNKFLNKDGKLPKDIMLMHYIQMLEAMRYGQVASKKRFVK
jgi:beta-glucosidase